VLQSNPSASPPTLLIGNDCSSVGTFIRP
jgi:hypothetical protein